MIEHLKGQITCAIIKPEAVEKQNTGSILEMINKAGFHIAAIKYIKMDKELASSFYAIHKGKHFFEDLISYMSSGPVIPMILHKEKAVEEFRRLIGATNPQNAVEGTVRKLFGESLQRNAVHGSDSDENAECECNFFFAETERYFI
ncbi:MAG: nucleoside-diphosphate kinase [Bacteroidia bacterium]|nr:nucleoside-diphosphate kinase [Bacteroidia bacterium]